ncbi:patatin-like phospholipase family protein [Flavobacteriaceae bacterium]|nr:patatin-like phospholipase family protein [Flavobacteriaceae bacterium]
MSIFIKYPYFLFLRFFFFTLLIASVFNLRAQTASINEISKAFATRDSTALQSRDKPLKVGLVLSGGGAKGLAHIGALKVIEASGVQIDYIAGTSMGAIVGALYASGYRAEELDSIFRQINFNSLIQDDFSRESKTFYEKEDAERYAISLPFDGYKISFPQAISGGQKVYNELVSLLFHVKDVRDFNQLPIPFFV